ncbi:unnamed protein product [Acanthoscelides obtectus]|uniref:Uncharacterized protein n=1 Tax=Acanthoscelides obtectus TaxID=200917 RepID=A0A9P0LJG3_ACAOB|nr:unnamed protein product [Acanthoscelides obtectus]CAK1670773.1 hypothetical protein AOBTE_LOCUS27821 [Acanthoscelides obtectus]
MLTNIKHNCTGAAHNSSAIEVFLAVSRNYEDTYQVVANLTRMYSFDTAIILFLDMNQMLVHATILYQGHATIADALSIFGISVRLLIWLVETKWIKQKPTELAPILAECEICYSSYELSSAKNTFLVQLLHEKIAIDYYGFMEMNASFLLSHSQQSMSLLIFLFQVTSTYMMKKNMELESI